MDKHIIRRYVKLISLIWSTGLASLLQLVWFTSWMDSSKKSWVAINNYGEALPELFITAFFWGITIAGFYLMMTELWNDMEKRNKL
ncbi:MAG: hypothetical protein WC444_05970 [Candidatus Paceibacterota bacterium]